MAKEDNLIDISSRPNHKELSAKGGENSAKAKKKMKNMREAARYLLESPILGDQETADALAELGLDADYQSATLLNILRKSANGDVEAARFVRDTSGQAPAQQVELGGMDGKPIEVMDLSGLSTEELQKLISSQSDT
jgi:hypothetical protein